MFFYNGKFVIFIPYSNTSHFSEQPSFHSRYTKTFYHFSPLKVLHINKRDAHHIPLSCTSINIPIRCLCTLDNLCHSVFSFHYMRYIHVLPYLSTSSVNTFTLFCEYRSTPVTYIFPFSAVFRCQFSGSKSTTRACCHLAHLLSLIRLSHYISPFFWKLKPNHSSATL